MQCDEGCTAGGVLHVHIGVCAQVVAVSRRCSAGGQCKECFYMAGGRVFMGALLLAPYSSVKTTVLPATIGLSHCQWSPCPNLATLSEAPFHAMGLADLPGMSTGPANTWYSPLLRNRISMKRSMACHSAGMPIPGSWGKGTQGTEEASLTS